MEEKKRVFFLRGKGKIKTRVVVDYKLKKSTFFLGEGGMME